MADWWPLSQDRLTRQELSWLLAQEARSAATALRRGVTSQGEAPPPSSASTEMAKIDIKEAPAVDATLDALDASIGLLSDLQSAAPSKARRGRIDLASLLYEVAPNARITMEPGAGTEVFGDEADLRRMLHVLVSETSNPAEAAAPEISIRREKSWVRISVELGPDSSSTTTMERRWLSRMSVRHGGRLELVSGTQSLLLPADASTEEVDDLRKELEQAQQLGEAYARELATAMSAGDVQTSSAEVPASSERFEAMVTLAAGLGRALRQVFEELRSQSQEASQTLGESASLTRELGRLTSTGYEIVGELSRLGGCGLDESNKPLDLSALVREIVQDAEGRAARHGVRLEIAASDGVSANVRVSAISLLLRSLVDHAVAAAPKDGVVHIGLRTGKSVAVLTVDDPGPSVPRASRSALLNHQTDPSALGRPAGVALVVANAASSYLDGTLALTETEEGTCRVEVKLPAP